VDIVLYILFFVSITCVGQIKRYAHLKNKDSVYCYFSLTEANKQNPDSVKGLIFVSAGFKDFPGEIFKYENLRFLLFECYIWGEKKDSLSIEDSLSVDDKKKYLSNKIAYDSLLFECYKPSIIKRLPGKLKKLKYLEILDAEACIIKNKKQFYRVVRRLKKCKVYPEKLQSP
jgi:hypothetical protein